MTQDSTTWKLLTEIVEEMTGVEADGLTPDLTFDELGFDSLTTVEIAVAAEMRLGVRIDEDQLHELRTMADAVNCIDALLGAAPEPAIGLAADPHAEQRQHHDLTNHPTTTKRAN